MKKFFALALVILTLVSASVSASAKFPQAAKGDVLNVPMAADNIKIDGELDKSYGLVFEFAAKDCYGVDTPTVRSGCSPVVTDANKAQYDPLESVGYMAWDENYLYFYVTMTDPNPIFVPALTYENRAKGLGIEFQFNKSEKDKAFVIIDAKGGVLATTADGRAQSLVKAGGKIISATKVAIELAIPWDFYGKTTPAVGNKELTFGYTACNRVQEGDKLGQRLYGFGGCLYREASLTGVPLVLGDMPVVEEAPAAAPAPTTQTKAPATVDPIALIAGIAVLSGVVVKARKK